MSKQGVFRFDECSFRFGYDMLVSEFIFAVSVVSVGGQDFDFIFFLDPQRQGKICVKAPGLAHFKVNNFISDPINSKPNVDFVSFFWQ